MNTRKSFSKKKELIKYLLDADSNAQEYILQISTKSSQFLKEENAEKQIVGLWYGIIAEKILAIKNNVKILKINVQANWWFTQIDSDSRHGIGEEAEVDRKWYQVAQLAEAIQNSKYLVNVEEFKLAIIHPLQTEHFDQLVETLNKLAKLKKIEIDFPEDTSCYYIEKDNWTQRLKVKPLLKLTSNYWDNDPRIPPDYY